MIFWVLAFAITATACAALFYAAAGRRAIAGAPAPADAVEDHFRLQLREIEADAASGKLGGAEAEAAKAELARELLRSRKDKAGPAPSQSGTVRPLLLGATAAVALLSFGVYGLLGHPDLPAVPLAERTGMTLEAAVARIEQQLLKTPEDLRGWTVVAPAYMELQRFDAAARAFARQIELDGPTAERETSLAEALMLANGGEPTPEVMDLFRSAAARDPRHVRSRYYLASELTRTGEFEPAVAAWNELLALSQGAEPWLEPARAGLAAAEAGLSGAPAPDDAAIAAMVEGLASRLHANGGSIAEWTRLVRSQLVLGRVEAAQSSYEAARAAYPDSAQRTELDVLAADHGLVAK